MSRVKKDPASEHLTEKSATSWAKIGIELNQMQELQGDHCQKQLLGDLQLDITLADVCVNMQLLLSKAANPHQCTNYVHRGKIASQKENINKAIEDLTAGTHVKQVCTLSFTGL